MLPLHHCRSLSQLLILPPFLLSPLISSQADPGVWGFKARCSCARLRRRPSAGCHTRLRLLVCWLHVRVETKSGSSYVIQYNEMLYNICILLIVMLNKSQIPLMRALLVPFVSRLSGRLSLHPLVLCIHYRCTFPLMETLESFTLLPYIMSLKLLPHLAQTFSPPFSFPSPRLLFSPPSPPFVCLRSSPIISRRHHITQQLVAGNQSACLTPPDGPPPPPSRPCSSSSSSALISWCLPVLLHVSRIITLRSPRTI